MHAFIDYWKSMFSTNHTSAQNCSCEEFAVMHCMYTYMMMYIFNMPEIILGRALDCIPQKMVRLGTMSEHI